MQVQNINIKVSDMSNIKYLGRNKSFRKNKCFQVSIFPFNIIKTDK